MKERVVAGVVMLCSLFITGAAVVRGASDANGMTEEQAARLGEEFGIVVGAVDEEIQ